jgi:signal transduction histidine kinase/ActR/RegA family two-component response regulator
MHRSDAEIPNCDTPVIPVAARLPSSSRWLALAVAAIGLIVLIGWALHIEFLKSVVPGMTSMKANTALCLILLAVSLAGANRTSRISSLLVFSSLFICGAISLLTAGEYLLGLNFHLDNCFFVDRTTIVFPGRMAPTTIVCFVLCSLGLLLLQLRRAAFFSQFAVNAVIGISLATLGGYLYGAPQMLAHAPYPVVALHTALCLVLLSIGALLMQPDQGPMRVMMADTTGGWLARRLIPTALAVPLAVGLCVVTGQRAGLYGAAFAVALTVSADIAVMTAVIWSVASLLSRTDALRQRTERAAEQHSRLKDNFLATLSHELRTPLTAILGWAVMLSRRTDLDPDAQEGVSVIERNARAQTRIVEDLLDMSRIISGKMRIEALRVDLREVVANAIQTARPGTEAKQLELRVTIESDLPAIMGDPNRIQQIAWNLLSNAIKFTPRGGWVSVNLARHQSQVRLAIEDNGEGIRPEFLQHLFQRFRQADESTTRRHGGLGLGLSIVRQLVELHGGTVQAHSRGEGMGSTFIVSFPVVATQHDSESDEAKTRTARTTQTTTLVLSSSQAVKGLRVLVVDDEADARSLIRRVLEECHAIVVTASSAEDAIARLDAEHFDVLVCDIGMPNQDGYDLIRAVRRRDTRSGGDLPAAALTAFARSEDRTRALTSGFQIHTAKPIEPSELIAAVASLARRERSD